MMKPEEIQEQVAAILGDARRTSKKHLNRGREDYARSRPLEIDVFRQEVEQ